MRGGCATAKDIFGLAASLQIDPKCCSTRHRLQYLPRILQYTHQDAFCAGIHDKEFVASTSADLFHLCASCKILLPIRPYRTASHIAKCLYARLRTLRPAGERPVQAVCFRDTHATSWPGGLSAKFG